VRLQRGEASPGGPQSEFNEREAVMSETIEFAVSAGVATLTLNRPEKRNAFNDEMVALWLRRLEECRDREDVRVLILTGAGTAFCSGGDLGRFDQYASSTASEIKQRVVDGIQRLALFMHGLDKPVIAAVNGVATGGGMDVALMCDLRFAAASARFAETYSRVGLVPGAGGAWYLPRLLGSARALELLWGGDFIDAVEAERIGLVNRVYPDAELQARTREFAERLAGAPPLSIRGIKRLVYQSLRCDLASSLDMVSSTLPVVRMSRDHQEALAALKEKRPGVYTGR